MAERITTTFTGSQYDFETLYRRGVLTYGRLFFGPDFKLHRRFARIYDEVLSLDHRARLLIVGCGLGFTLPFLKERGFGAAEGQENSPYLLTIKDQAPTDETIHWIDVDQVSGPFDVVVTEDMMSCLGDADVPAFLNLLENRFQPKRICHLVSIGRGDSMLNWKTDLAEWSAFRSTHTWTDSHGRS